MSRVAIDPVVWSPPAAPARAKRRSGPLPFPPARIIPLDGRGPEDVVVDAEGMLLCGLDDGRVVRVSPQGGATITVGNTGGRPIGLEVSRDGRVLVCDAKLGLLRLDPRNGALETLVDLVDGVRLKFCSNAAEAADGTIYFTESSSRFDLDNYRGDLLEHRGAGRLFARHPDGTVVTLLTGLYFANGVALTADESAVIVAETGAYQVSRLGLTGADAGRRTVIAANLAGFPDNISRSPDGLIWVAMAAPRNPLLDAMSRRAAVLRKFLWRVPEQLQPAAERTVWVIAMDENGTIVHDLQAQRADYNFVTGVVESNGHLYLSSLVKSALLEVDLR